MRRIIRVYSPESLASFSEKATVYAQTSRHEGKSIAIDEAMILHKPIVVTNFSTAKDQIIDNYHGLIAEMNPESIAATVLKYFEEKNVTQKICSNLQQNNYITEHEIEIFYKLIND